MLNQARLTVGIVGAFVAGGGMPGNPLLIAMSNAMAKAIVDELLAADVDATAGIPPMTTGAGAVAGFGKIK